MRRIILSKMKIKKIIVLFLVTLIFTSCQTVTPPVSPTTTLLVTITQELPPPTQVPSLTPTITFTPTLKPSLTQTPIEVAPATSSTWDGGGIWVFQEAKKAYWVIDSVTGNTLHIVPLPEGCDYRPIAYTAIILCTQASGNYSLDLETGLTKPLPSQHSIGTWLSSPDGNYLAFWAENLNKKSDTFIYNRTTEEETKLTTNIFQTFNADWFALSVQGKYYAISQMLEPYVYQAYVINGDSLDIHQVSPKGVVASGDLAWSPVRYQLVYGVTTAFREIGLNPDQIYLKDFLTGSTRLVASKPARTSYDNFWYYPIWSPDGRKLALPLEQDNICIVDLSTDAQSCYPVAHGPIISISWSPDSQKVALVVSGGYLKILDVKSGEITTTEKYSSEIIRTIFWR
jgi:Tol biopolymer transport system component